MLAFAFDLGNGFVKARSSRREIIAPSVISKKESVGSSSLTNIAIDNKVIGYQEYESNLDDGVTYIWGEEINKAVDPDSLIQTYTHNNRYSQKRFKLLCSFILSELASDFEEHELDDVILVTGLPSLEIDTKDAEMFKEFLQQKHVITRNGEQRVINVQDVRIIEQPLGTLLNEYMNEQGKIHKELLTSTITVIDFGAGTTIVDTFKNLNRISDKSDTYYEGINDVHKRIAKQVEKANGIKGLKSSLIEEGFKNKTFIADISDRKKYSFANYVEQVIIDSIDKHISEIDTTLTNRNSIDKFILTGGGVNVVGKAFKTAFNEESLHVVEQSQKSNVNGFFKLANTIANKKNQSTIPAL